MAVVQWPCSKEQALSQSPTSVNRGNGHEKHAPVGLNVDGWTYRDLMQFTLAWAGVYQITKAKLWLQDTGAPADVFAAASPKEPAALLAKGLVEKPVEFATNTLVLIVPKRNPAHITSVADITKPGVKLVICNATVPCGDYARTAFKNLGITTTAMKNVVSQTTDVTQTVAQVATGQADAGFVYITDAKAAGGRVAVVGLPAKAKPSAKDFIAVVKSGKNQAAAKAFVQTVLSAAGQAKLEAAGFGKP